ncbi:MAG: tetratricopeptide repeat protein [Candidatus Omnitrophica bacterium]|nr:tetratricopeptide repeat protein [Candidatus Omnitrophota bacterium]MDD5690744.1 tetratricopeptide repeat protein [Candidatus Omnitrophota bacterium]
MKKTIILLCLVLAGCATVPSENKIPSQASKVESTVTIDQKELDNIINVFSQAIKTNPNYAGAYYNRAVAYYYKNNYDKSWEDIHKAQELGFGNDSMLTGLVNRLKKATGREK